MSSPTLMRPTVIIEQSKPRAKLLLLGHAPALTNALPGVALPLRPNSAVRTEGLGVCLWLRPDQRLMLLEADADPLAIRRIRTFSAPEAWGFDAGARFVAFVVHGHGASAVINGGCSLDLREAAFPVESCAQTRIDQSPVLLYRSSPERFEVFVERPLAPHLWLWLCRAAGNI